MLRTGNTDLITFLISAVVGVALCLLYDAFRILRLAKRPSAVSGFVQDVLYFLLAAMITFLNILVRCSGEVRWFVLVGELVGAIICRMTVSRVLMAVSGAIIKFIKAVISFIKKRVIMPVRHAFSWVYGIILKFTKFLFKKFVRLLKKCLKPLYNLLYNILNKLFKQKQKAEDNL